MFLCSEFRTDYANGYYNEMAYFVDEGYCVMTYNCTGTYTSEGKGIAEF